MTIVTWAFDIFLALAARAVWPLQFDCQRSRLIGIMSSLFFLSFFLFYINFYSFYFLLEFFSFFWAFLIN